MVLPCRGDPHQTLRYHVINIHDIATWTPGTMMRMDVNGFFALGIVVSNDGNSAITVVWDSRCHQQFRTYNVRSLSPIVVSHFA